MCYTNRTSFREEEARRRREEEARRRRDDEARRTAKEDVKADERRRNSSGLR